METYLAHHGILGMKWGVRRYQNEDGTLTAAGKLHYRRIGSATKQERIKNNADLRIDAGTRMYRISEAAHDTGDRRYVTYRQNDSDFYEGYWAAQKQKAGTKVYKQEYITNETLFIPSAKKRTQILSNIADDPTAIEHMARSNNWPPDSMKEYLRKQNADGKAAAVARSLGYTPYLMEIYGKKIVEHGFNATIDDNGRTVGEMPLILFTANKTLTDKGSRIVDDIMSNAAKQRYDRKKAALYRMNTAAIPIK